MSKRGAEGPHRTKEEGLEMSSIGGEAPKRATAAQMANRTIKSARGRRTRVTPSTTMPSQGASTPFGNIDPNIGPPATSQAQPSFSNNGFAFGQSQSFPPANTSSAQPAQNGTSISFGGASNPPSFNFSSNFSGGQAPSNPFSNTATTQSGSGGGFQGFQGSLFNLSAENQNNQGANNSATPGAGTGFNNMTSAPPSNTLFGASQGAPSFGQGSGAPSSGGIFSQNTSKPGSFGQQQPFGTGAPSTPSQSAGLFGGGGDAMQTTPDGKTRADAAPKTALFGMGTQPPPAFGSNTTSAPGGSIFSSAPTQNKPFSFTSGATSEQQKPTAPTSGGSSMFGRISSPAPPTQATDSSAPNGPTPAPAKDTAPKTTGAETATTADSSKPTSANPFASAFKPSPAPTTATDSAPTSTSSGNVFASAFKPSAPSSTSAATGSSLFASSKPPTTSSNAFSTTTPSFGQGPSSQSSGASIFAKPQGTSSDAAPAATPSLFGASSAPTASTSGTTAPAAPAASLFGAPSATSTGPSKTASLFAAASQGQSSTNMFAPPASDSNKKPEDSAASSDAQAKPTGNGNQAVSTPNLFSATPSFGGATGGNLFAPKPTAQPASAPDSSSQDKAQGASSLFSGSQSASKTSSAPPSNMFAKPSAPTGSSDSASKPTLFGETSKASTATAPASTPSLFDSSKPPSAASIFAPSASAAANPPPLFGAPSNSDASKMFSSASPPKNQLAPAAPLGQELTRKSSDANKENSIQKTKETGVSSYGPSSIPKNLTKDQKAQYDKTFRIRSLNESFKKKITEMDPADGDFLSLIHYYVRVRDAIGCPTGLVRKAGMKRTNDESFDNEAEPKRAKRKTESTADESSEETTKQITYPSIETEPAGDKGGRMDSPKKASTTGDSQKPGSSLFSTNDFATSKRKADDEGEGRSGSPANQAGKRSRNAEEPESTTTSLFASSFAGSSSTANKFSFGGDSNKSQAKPTNEASGKSVPEIKIGSSEGNQTNGDAPTPASNGRSLFDRIQYDDQGQAKRASSAEEESSKEKEKKALSDILGSKFGSSFNAPGTSSPKPFKNNFDFAAATRSASGSPGQGSTPSAFPPPPKTDQGQTSSSGNDKPADSATSAKPPSNIFGSPAPTTFGSKSILGSSTGDNTWKNDSPIRFSASKPESTSTSSATTTTPAPAFPALFGGQRDKKTEGTQPNNIFSGNLGSGSQPAGFGFGGSLAKPATQSANLSAASSAEPSRSTTPGLTSDATGADESGDGEANLPQVDLTRPGAGEEDEDVIFEVRASAFRLEKGKGWEKRGEGPIRVLKHRENGRSRIVLRADPSGKVVLNVSLREGHPYNASKDSVNILVPEAEDKLVQWAVRVRPADKKKVECAVQLAEHMKENST